MVRSLATPLCLAWLCLKEKPPPAWRHRRAAVDFRHGSVDQQRWAHGQPLEMASLPLVWFTPLSLVFLFRCGMVTALLPSMEHLFNRSNWTARQIVSNTLRLVSARPFCTERLFTGLTFRKTLGTVGHGTPDADRHRCSHERVVSQRSLHSLRLLQCSPRSMEYSTPTFTGVGTSRTVFQMSGALTANERGGPVCF